MKYIARFSEILEWLVFWVKEEKETLILIIFGGVFFSERNSIKKVKTYIQQTYYTCLLKQLKRLNMLKEHHNPTIINTLKIQYHSSIMEDSLALNPKLIPNHEA